MIECDSFFCFSSSFVESMDGYFSFYFHNHTYVNREVLFFRCCCLVFVPELNTSRTEKYQMQNKIKHSIVSSQLSKLSNWMFSHSISLCVCVCSIYFLFVKFSSNVFLIWFVGQYMWCVCVCCEFPHKTTLVIDNTLGSIRMYVCVVCMFLLFYFFFYRLDSPVILFLPNEIFNIFLLLFLLNSLWL
mgnify:CR=1 FL=1